MTRTVLAIVLLASFALPATLTAVARQKADPIQIAQKPAEKKQKGKRLPPHYGKVVDEKQRQTIYQIQAEYQARIDALRAQLEALVNERDAKIRAVLSPQQAQVLDTLIAEADAARAAKAAKKKAAINAEKQ